MHRSVPRMRGDDPHRASRKTFCNRCSPHARGRSFTDIDLPDFRRTPLLLLQMEAGLLSDNSYFLYVSASIRSNLIPIANEPIIVARAIQNLLDPRRSLTIASISVTIASTPSVLSIPTKS